MKMMELTIPTSERRQCLNVTDQINEVVGLSGINEGLCHVYVPHATAALVVNEAKDSMVMADLLDSLAKLVPADGDYRHHCKDDNAHAHVQATILGNQRTLFIRGGCLWLGTYPQIFFCELDGPRERRLRLALSDAAVNSGAAPRTPWNPDGARPLIDPTSYISPRAAVIGRVHIGRGVFVGPFASIRGDEGGPIHIGDGGNVQDGAILHALLDQTVEVAGERYAIHIGQGVSVSHGAIVHGPAAIDDNTFVGFGAVVFQARIGRDVVILHRAVVSGDVAVPDGRMVPAGAVIESQEQADVLPPVPAGLRQMQLNVVRVNHELARAYRESVVKEPRNTLR